MKKSFLEASYLSQVRRLRNLAERAVARYPIKVKSINFIHHGENTTFRADAKNGRKYLLRIHRNDYHTKAAIQEELAWLTLLSKRGISVPTPVLSKSGEVVETIFHPEIEVARNCSMFEWIDGRFLNKALKPKHLYQVGEILAELQSNTPRAKVTRRYWTADGLVGTSAKFGSIDHLPGVHPKQQTEITRARKQVLKKLRQFEQKFPEKQGLIHADLHFGNILSTGKALGAIDFDDCGFGFHGYDLVIPIISVKNMLGEKDKKRLPEFKDALIAGYSSRRTWDTNDEMIFPYLFAARRLLMLGWVYSRADNPRIRKYLKGAVEGALTHVRGALSHERATNLWSLG